jgi:hypothetical protein
MNELEFEKDLRKLRPAAPSRTLEESIARGLAERRAEEPQRMKCLDATEKSAPWFTLWLDRLLWSGLGAAAAVMFVMASHKPPVLPAQDAGEKHVVRRDAPARDASALQPVLASEEDFGWHDEGIQFDAQGHPMLKLRRVSVERKALADLENPGVIQVETPRQEVMWVPVTLH